MEAAQKRYETKVNALTAAINKAEEGLKKDAPVLEEIIGYGPRILWCKDRFIQASDSLIDLKTKNDEDVNVLSVLEIEQGEWISKCDVISQKLDSKVIEMTRKEDPASSNLSVSSINKEHRHRLPKLELPKFSGDIRDWLQFWSQFETVHKDDGIEAVVKFQYLIQSIQKGSKAYDIVASYPVTEENYPMAITSLTERYGREEILVEVYVRDLIKLIVNNKTSDFSQLYVKLSSQLRALGTLGVTTDKCASILYPIVESTLPEDVLLAWERQRMATVHISGKVISEVYLDQLMKFLQDEVSGKERIRLARQGLTESPVSKARTYADKKTPATATAATLLTTEKQSDVCVFCDKDHPSQECSKASQITYEEKIEQIKKKRRCFHCLRSGHQSKRCRTTVKCVCCGRKHWTVMCKQLNHGATGQRNEEDHKKKNDKQETTSVEMCNHTKSVDRVLQTVLVRIFGDGEMKTVRAIMDSCSEKSYILQRTADEIGLKAVGKEKVIHILFGGIQTAPQDHRVFSLQVSNMDSSFVCTMEVSDKACISGKVKRVPPGPWKDELAHLGIRLSDDIGTDDQKEIEILIGADFYGKLLTGKKVDLKTGPTAIETKLGWTLLGKLVGSEDDEANYSVTHHVLDTEVTNLWSLDIIGITPPEDRKSRVEIEAAALKHFLETVTFNEDGRYVVQLPWLADHPPLPTNRAVAEKRLLSTTKELKRVDKLKGYHEVFQNWLQENIIEEIPEEQWSNYGHYLGHRAVFKPGSTTSIRPVFNASAKTKHSPSLNECLEKGPNLLEEIPDILIRFRLHKVGVISDIKKAFLQMEVAEKDRDFLRFVWWSDTTCSKMKMFRHCRVVFGVSCSPFLLGAVLNHLLDNSNRYEDTATKLKKSFYVDNCVISLPSVEMAEKFKEEAVTLMSGANFDLRGWEFGPTNEEKEVSVLGLKWNVNSDHLYCDATKLKTIPISGVTKRSILSLAQGVFDPLGVLAAFTIIPRMLMQKAWKLKVGWDNGLPEDITKAFDSWRRQLAKLEDVKIPRNCCNEDQSTFSLHIFTDSSKDAYAACCFLRSGDSKGRKIQLIFAKSRVAPLKNMTIPRLELLACGIGARLYDNIKRNLGVNVPVTFWSDSTTALSWIHREENWSRFVDNRVKEILKLTSASWWRHVPGKMNPADLPSRGTTISHLVEIRWWEGPQWLYEENNWPSSSYQSDEHEVNEEKKKTVISCLNEEAHDVFSRIVKYSDYHKMLRVLGFCRRYLKNLYSRVKERPENVLIGPLSYEEIQGAELRLLKYSQESCFTDGVKDDRLKTLRCFTDEVGLIRIKSRVLNGSDGFSTPIVLPSKSDIVWKLIWKYHTMECHAGTGMLQSRLREQFWIIKSRRTIRNVIRNCAKCRRFQSQPMKAPEPPLPSDRVRVGIPFSVTGVDMAGPLFVKGNKKVYIAIFTCASYRAVHLELVNSLTTECFLMALRRFVARRGRPATAYSDNGKNLWM